MTLAKHTICYINNLAYQQLIYIPVIEMTIIASTFKLLYNSYGDAPNFPSLSLYMSFFYSEAILIPLDKKACSSLFFFLKKTMQWLPGALLHKEVRTT